ncbi:MAG: hypothetical protein KDB58_07500 [Solirubrobacterales bacterium]|nr:hypothetical protein [Solirubrobacterales bacterium]
MEESARIAQVNARRASGRGYVVIATDPDRHPDDAGYRVSFTTEARSPNEAISKVRRVAGDRRLRAFLMSAKYEVEIAEATWIG